MKQMKDKNYFLSKLLKDREIGQLLEGETDKNINGFIESLKEIKNILHIKEETDKKILEEYNKIIVIPSGSEETLIKELNIFNKAMYDWPEHYILNFENDGFYNQNRNLSEDSVAKRLAKSEQILAEKKGQYREKIEQSANQLNSVEKRKLEAQKILEQQVILNNEDFIKNENNSNDLKYNENNSELYSDNDLSISEKLFILEQKKNKIKDELNELKNNDRLNLIEFNKTIENAKVNLKLNQEKINEEQKKLSMEFDNESHNILSKFSKVNLNDKDETENNSANDYLKRINKIEPLENNQIDSNKTLKNNSIDLDFELDNFIDKENILFDENNLPIEFDNDNLYFDSIDQLNQNLQSNKKIDPLSKNIFGLSQPHLYETSTEFEPTQENTKDINSKSVRQLSDEQLTMITNIWEKDVIDPIGNEDLSDFEKRLIDIPTKTKKNELIDDIHNEIIEKENNILKDTQEIIVDSEEEKNEQLNDIKNDLELGNYGRLNLSKPVAITCARYMKKLNYLKKGFEKSYGSELFKKVRDWIHQENLMYENAERNNRIKKLKTKRFKNKKSILQKQRIKELFKIKK